MNKASVLGLILAIVAILAGNFIEGGRINVLLQPAAALVVLGGTIGATLLSCAEKDIIMAIRSLKLVFVKNNISKEILMKNIIGLSYAARKRGLIALQDELENINDPFFMRAIKVAIEHPNSKTVRELLEKENLIFEYEMKNAAKVFEIAGGYSPTLGILGAVLGLIHVMGNLTEPSKLGAGIAIAFVATIYGVGFANLILLPIAKKINNWINMELFRRQIIIDGIIGVQNGINPFFLEDNINIYFNRHPI